MAYRKYGNKKTVVNGIRFDSTAESERYKELLLMESSGEIKNLELQPKFEIHPKFQHNGKTERAIHYVADFSYIDSSGDKVVEDVKGMETDVFKLKRKLFLKRYGSDYDFRIIS